MGWCKGLWLKVWVLQFWGCFSCTEKQHTGREPGGAELWGLEQHGNRECQEHLGTPEQPGWKQLLVCINIEGWNPRDPW